MQYNKKAKELFDLRDLNVIFTFLASTLSVDWVITLDRRFELGRIICKCNEYEFEIKPKDAMIHFIGISREKSHWFMNEFSLYGQFNSVLGEFEAMHRK